MKKLAVIFPGIGYHKDKPLLYYAAKLARSAGYEVMDVSYHDMPEKIKGDEAMMQKAAEIGYMQAVEQLKDKELSQYAEVLFLGKSIGTVIMARYAAECGIEAKQVWYTPVEATFSFPSKKMVAFLGDADPWSDVKKLKEKADALGIRLYMYAGGNHSLETGEVDRDISYLQEVMEITKEFITGR